MSQERTILLGNEIARVNARLERYGVAHLCLTYNGFLQRAELLDGSGVVEALEGPFCVALGALCLSVEVRLLRWLKNG